MAVGKPKPRAKVTKLKEAQKLQNFSYGYKAGKSGKAMNVFETANQKRGYMQGRKDRVFGSMEKLTFTSKKSTKKK